MKSLLKSFSSFSIGPIVGALLGFMTIPAITYFISPEEYGRASMFTLAQGLASMLMYLGMDQAFVREYNLFKKNTSKLLVNAIIVPMVCMLILAVIILLNKEYISYLLFGSRKYINAVILFVLMLPFMIGSNFSLLKIRMDERGLIYSFFTILLKFLTLVFTLGLLSLYERTFKSVIYAIVISEIMNGTLLSVLVLGKTKITFKFVDKELMMRMIKFGLPLVPAAMLIWVLSSMDKVMLRAICNYSELGLYSAAFKIVNVLGIAQACFTLFWTPVAYRWHEECKSVKLFENAGYLLSLAMSSICLLILLFKDVINLFLGADFAKAVHIFPFLLLYPIMYTVSEVTAVGIGFTRKTTYNILVSAISGVSNILLNYILIPIYGGMGAAIATGISYMVFFWARTLASRKVWERFNISQYVMPTIVLVVNCLVHTIIIGKYAYICTIISIAALGIMHKKKIFCAFKEIINEF